MITKVIFSSIVLVIIIFIYNLSSCMNISNPNDPRSEEAKDIYKPTGLKMSDEIYYDRITIYWNKINNVDYYSIYRSETSKYNDYELIAQSKTPFYKDENTFLIANKDYYYKITATLLSGIETKFSKTIKAFRKDKISNITPPDMSGITPTNNITPTWMWICTEEVTGFRYQLDGTDDNNWGITNTFDFKPITPLADGEYTLYLQARDTLHDWSNISYFTIRVDTSIPTAPTVIIAESPTNILRPVWSWEHIEHAISYRCELNRQPDKDSPVVSNQINIFTPENDLEEGSHMLYVQAKNEAGTWSTSGAAQVIIDITSPESPVIHGDIVTASQRPAWNWDAVADVDYYLYQIDGTTDSWNVTKNESYTTDYNLSDTGHVFYLKSVDEAGNESNINSFTTYIDRQVPAIDQTGDIILTEPINNTHTIDFITTDDYGIEKVEIIIDNQLKETIYSPPYTYIWNTSNESDETHDLIAKAYDYVGNYGTYRKSFPVDNFTFSKYYSGSSGETISDILVLDNNEYLLGGSTNSFGQGSLDMLLVKIDNNGNIIWQKCFGEKKNEHIVSTVKTDNGDIFLGGYSYSFNGPDYGDLLLLKIDDIGEIIWQKLITIAGEHNQMYSMTPTNDNGVITTASTDDDIWIIKHNNVGELQWNVRYEAISNATPYSIQQTNDMGYIIAAQTTSYVWILKLTQTGQMSWERFYENGTGVCGNITQTQDGGYIFSGTKRLIEQDENVDFWVVKLFNNGQIEWQKTYGTQNDERKCKLRLCNDGGYLLFGESGSNNSEKYQFFLIKIDEVGKKEWCKIYGDISDGIDDLEILDDNYIISAYKESYDFGENDIWMLKLNGTGSHLGKNIEINISSSDIFPENRAFTSSVPDNVYVRDIVNDLEMELFPTMTGLKMYSNYP